jgi:hypothetical protein
MKRFKLNKLLNRANFATESLASHQKSANGNQNTVNGGNDSPG